MENFDDILLDSTLDTLKDSVWVVVLLFITYLVMEFIEHRFSNKAREAIKRAGWAGPAIGSALGIVPQCGFSAAASAFYAGRVITVGTLIAVYLSTSDEMLPVMIAGKMPAADIAIFLGLKLAIGMFFGFVIDGAIRIAKVKQPDFKIHDVCKQAHCNCSGHCSECEQNPTSVYGHHETDHEHKHNHEGTSIVLSALKHTVQVGVFIILISLVLNVVLGLVGTETIVTVFKQNAIVTVLLSGLIGLIPNCAASVAITQLYVGGVLGMGATMAGLLSSAGVGLLVLFRTNRPQINNIQIVIVLYCISVICGIVITAIVGAI